jgi:toxin ParE1/3/4
MRVRLTLAARHDLVEIAKWVAKDNPKRALSLMDDLQDSCRALKDFPEAFPIVVAQDGMKVRRKLYGNFLIFYHILPEVVEILYVRHGSRDNESLFT